MNTDEILKIAYDTMTKPIDEIDLSMYSQSEQIQIQKAMYRIQARIDAMIDEALIERRG